MKYRKLMTAMVVVAVAGVAHASTWTGGGIDNEFSTTNNWNDGGINGTQDINGNYTVERSVNNTAQRTFVRGGATLNVTGGTHNDNRSGASIYNFLGDGSKGTVNQSGGTYSIGHSLRVGTGNNANSDGTYNLTGGLLSVYRGSNSAIDSSNPGGRPSMEIGSYGTLGTGLLEISGGAMETRGGVHIGYNGTFSIVGSDATSIGIGSNQSADGVWLQESGSILKVGIDGSGITKIFVDDVDGDNGMFAEFRSGSLLDLDFENGVTPYEGTWTILELENAGITDLGLGLAGTTGSGWSFNVDNTGTNGLLTATYAIPEPATLGFFAAAGAGMLFIRRRFKI